MTKEALRASTAIPAAPTTLYFAWLDAEQHSAMTGGAAKIDPNVGGKFTAWNGYISGKFITLDLGRRIIMSWRTTDFPRDAHDSRVEVHFEALGGSTRLTVLHTEIPEGQGERYKTGWVEKYFTPMRTYFSKYLPDPRNPPVRRPPPPPESEEEVEEAPKAKAKLAKGKVLAKPAPSKPAKAPAKPAPKAAAKPSKPAAKPAPKPAKPAPKPAKPAAKPAKPAAKPAKAVPKKAAKPAKAVAKKVAKPVAKKAAKPAAKKPAKPAKKKR